MDRIMLKSKIHRATVTGADLHYEGSITIDKALMEKADIVHGEQVHVLDINNGSRFVTYVIEADAGTGSVVLNGAAARLVEIGDKVIILSYCAVRDFELPGFRQHLVFVDENNAVRDQSVDSLLSGSENENQQEC